MFIALTACVFFGVPAWAVASSTKSVGVAPAARGNKANKPASAAKASGFTREILARPDRFEKLGAISVGLPHTGVLVNGVKMPSDSRWTVTMPSHGFATEETVQQLSHCIRAVHDEIPHGPPVMLGSLSARSGGRLPPHKSHRTGRDADVYFFRKPGAQWSKAATADDIDLPRTWALLRCFVTDTDVEMVLIERKVQVWLQAYARSIGEPEQWLDTLFYDVPGTKSAVVRHVPGHVAHMHVRFVSSRARRLARLHYKELVAAGLVSETVERVSHRVRKGDTLLGLAKRYKTRVAEIQRMNGLAGTVIKIGQSLTVQQGVPIEGATAAVHTPARRLPPKPCEPGAKACHAGLAVIGAVTADSSAGPASIAAATDHHSSL